MFKIRISLRKSVWLPVALCLGLVTGGAWGQEVRATLGGRVTDSQGGVVQNAKVTVTSEETSVEQHTTTNESGNWSVQFLLPGSYHFSVVAEGFKTTGRPGVILQTGDNKTIDVQLQVGATTQTIDVTDEVPLIDTTMATSGTVV